MVDGGGQSILKKVSLPYRDMCICVCTNTQQSQMKTLSLSHIHTQKSWFHQAQKSEV